MENCFGNVSCAEVRSADMALGIGAFESSCMVLEPVSNTACRRGSVRRHLDEATFGSEAVAEFTFTTSISGPVFGVD